MKPTPTFADIARAYHDAIHAARRASVDAEPEAQLTTPVGELLKAVAQRAGLGELEPIREARLVGVRPDLAIAHVYRGNRRLQGYVELKKPELPVDTSLWSGRNLAQWDKLKLQAEVLIICNGRSARLYFNGEPVGDDATLPYQSPQDWDAGGLMTLLRRFLEAKPRPITSVPELSRRLALRTAELRDRLLTLIDPKTTDKAGELARSAHGAWKQYIHPHASAKDFADGISQVVAYGMVLAVLTGRQVDKDDDGIVSVHEAQSAIREQSPVMAAAFAPLLDQPALHDAVQVELGALETLLSAVNADKIRESKDTRGEPWMYFYEDFLSVYDPEERKQAGVYYTPTAVVNAMVKMVEHLLIERFDLRLGFADPNVVTLDPATGTGTFPLAVLDAAAARAKLVRGKAGPLQAGEHLSKNLIGFELLPGPYAVAHLRLSERLRELTKTNLPVQVVLTDTLEDPVGAETQMYLFGDGRVLAQEQNRAKRIKAERKVTVVIGNPPYRRVKGDIEGRGSGGWVLTGPVPGRKKGGSLFGDLRLIAQKHGHGVHFKNAYNLYVYFWRWSLWKAFEAHGEGPGVVALITGASWLTGHAFGGLRQLARELADEVWVIDLGGDNRGANPEENVFAIETPVAVVVLVRGGKSNPKQLAPVHYRRVSGTTAEKLAAMERVTQQEDPLEQGWVDVNGEAISSFVPASEDPVWSNSSPLTELFPWTHTGAEFQRTWAIGETREVLQARWTALMQSKDRAKAFVENRDRVVSAVYPALFTAEPTGAPIATEPQNAPCPRIERYGFRSFQRSWCLADNRIGTVLKPVLWNSHSAEQLFLTTLLTAQTSAGPLLTVATHIPDKHHFRGSFGGRDIFPLYRDAKAEEPNITRGLLTKLGKHLNRPAPKPEALAAYVYAVLSSPRYQERFAEALKTPGPRVPMTADAALWDEAVALGTWLLWLHTYAERLQDKAKGRGRYVPFVPGLDWHEPVRTMPETSKDFSYDPETRTLSVGDGRVGGVAPEVWDFEVSGMPVVKKWLAYRTQKGAGKATSSESALDHIRPTAWADEWNDELLELLRVLTLTVEKHPEQALLVDRICDGPLIPASELPKPKDAERKPPKGE
ncbi:N-6 DNA methylase [Myxococcota bacterium]|nr:N-6 DNA methylase [Myxococcota bacterium]